MFERFRFDECPNDVPNTKHPYTLVDDDYISWENFDEIQKQKMHHTSQVQDQLNWL